MIQNDLVARLWVDPAKKYHHVRLRLVPTLKRMREVDRILFPGGLPTEVLAFCAGRLHGPRFAEIVIPFKNCTPEIVAHEVTHAALVWARIKKVDFGQIAVDGGNHEEIIAEAAGSLMAQAYARIERWIDVGALSIPA